MKIFFSFFTIVCMVFQLQAQITVSGRVTSAADDGESVIGATILEKGTGNGTTTDFDGNYELTIAGQEATLVISYIGLETQEIQVGNRTTIDVILNEEASLLEEVIVVGYGTEKRSKISGAVAVLNADEISETPILRPEQALQGRISGVQVAQNSGSPGSALTVLVRGVSTINNSSPLFIVDGIPVDGMDFLNPADIESINVLKDAASAAIYGSRGANGVVLITTKGGKKKEEGKISYDAYYGSQEAWKHVNLLSAREYAILSNEAHIAAGKTPLPEFANPDALGEGTDWQSAIFQAAPMTNHQVTFRGGSEKSTYMVSGNYYDQNGIVGGEKANFNRYTARLNVRHDVKDWLTIGSNINFIHFTRDALAENNEFNTPVVRALNMDPVTPIRKHDGTFAYSIYSDTDITNPVNAIQQTYSTWTTNRVVAGAEANLKIMEGLNFRSSYSLDVNFATLEGFNPIYDLSNHPALNDAPAGERGIVNSVFLNHNTWTNNQWENVLTYEKYFGGAHDLKFTLGNTIYQQRFEFSGGSNTNLPTNNPNDAYISNTIDPIASQGAYGGANEAALVSYFGRVNYAYRDKYLFSATLRMDGSSRFGVNNRYGYFPSFSAGWILTNEDFWTMDDISHLKIRASWGQNGNDKIGEYAFTTVVLSGQNYTFGRDEIITNGSVALVGSNPDLKWETITQTDIGVDLELWQGKVNVIADYFIKTTSDMLYAAPIPLIAGTQPPVQNVASMENKGWEFALNYRNRDNDFKYGVGANITLIDNKVTSLGNGGEPVPSGRVQSANAFAALTDVGHPLASFYGYVTDGIFQSQEEVNAHAFQNENTAPGDIRFRDLNSDGVIDINDRTFIGNPIPKFTYGFTADAEFKGFDFSAFVQGSEGNDIYNSTVRYDFSYVNRPVSALNRWTGPGTSNFEPRVNLNDPNQNARISDRFIEDGSYLRLKNVQLGYTLPKDISKKMKFDKFRVYVSAQNLMTWTNYSGLDPEIGTIGGSLELGIDRGFYPQARTFLGGVNVVF